MLRKLRRLAELSPAELLVFSQLTAFALAARFALTFLRLSRVTEFAARGAHNRFLRCLPLFQSRYEITRLTRLADYAARATRFDGPCLVRSLLLFWLLKSRGEAAELLIGVSKEASALNSHAWVETQGNIIGDSLEMTGRFAPLLRL
jgi:Transglutaminase-like superfamily